MKKSIYILALGIATATGFNSKAQSVSYTYVRNDPFDTKNFSASIDPFFIDVNGNNGYAFGWGLRGEYMMGKALMFNFDSRFGFGTNLYRQSNDNTRNYLNIDGGIGLIFSNKAHNRNLPIILSQSTSYSGNYKTTTTVYIKGGVPAKVRTIVALRLGVFQYNNTVKFDAKGIGDSLLTFSAGGNTVDFRHAQTSTVNPVFEYTVASTGTPTTPTKVQVDKYGAIAMTSLYAGLNFRTIHNLVIDVDGYGLRSNIRYSDFFIDVLYSPILNFKDFKSGDVTYEVKYTEKTSFGWRIGGFSRKPKDQGFSFKWEIGSRPGFKADKKSSIPVNWRNTYFMFTMGLYIPLKIKPVYMGD